MSTPTPGTAGAASAGPPDNTIAPSGTSATGTRPSPLTKLPVSELIRLAQEQFSQLARAEVQRVQAEVAAKGKHLGVGAGMFGGAGVITCYASATLVAGLVLLLALVIPAWAAALLVALALFLLAGVLALIGRSQIRKGTPLMPREAIDGIKADIAALAETVRR